MELLQEKVGLFAEMTHFQAEEDGVSGMPLPALPRGLFRSESLESPRGERLLRDAIREGEGSLSSRRGEALPSAAQDEALDQARVKPTTQKGPRGFVLVQFLGRAGKRSDLLLLAASPSGRLCRPLGHLGCPLDAT